MVPKQLAPGWIYLFLLVSCQLLVESAYADTYEQAVDDLDLDELIPLADTSVLGSHGRKLPETERAAASVLVDLGVIDAEEIDQPETALPGIRDFIDVAGAQHPGLVGRIGDPSTYVNLERSLDHDELLQDQAFIGSLHQALADGVLTGYDLRTRAVYDNFPGGRYFIYSQSSLKHIQQLVTMMHREDIAGWLYVVPKVSAFLFRDDWGEPGENVVSLPDGRLVVQGREMAVLFRFDSASDRARFHDLVTRYAKKDEAEEAGLIVNSWWQPFYYTDEQLDGFEPISLVILSKGDFEATLTVLPGRTEDVVGKLKDGDWTLRVDEVWVNPPFFRFLNGGFK
ncbi:MAG: hypothetical protein ISP91_03935 [Pseudomonadales bacterium]|nr:hypothetical protein [Pseudomonadales bacterium]